MSVVPVYYKGEEKLAMVSKEDFDEVSKLKWRTVLRITKDGKEFYSYPMTTIENKVIAMHEMVMGKIPEGKDVIDHINGNRFDNRRKNLRFLTCAENSVNFSKNKKEGFLGVNWLNNKGKYRALYSSKYLGLFDDEIMAATQYDKHILYLGMNKDLCNFKYSDDEVKMMVEEYKLEIEKVQEKELPEHITSPKKGVFRVMFRRTNLKFTKDFYSLEEALAKRDEILEKFERENKPLQKEITKTSDGIAFIAIPQKDKEDFIVLVDEDKWHEISKINWHLDTYPKNTNHGVMHRWLWKKYKNPNLDSKTCIDHINKPKYDSTKMIDNRLEMLRESTHSENNHNKTVVNKNGYKGVFEVTGRPGWFRGEVWKNGKKMCTSNFKNIHQAALAYNLTAKEVYGEKAVFNEIPEGTTLDKPEAKNKYTNIAQTKSGSWQVKIPKWNVNKTFKDEEEAVMFRNSCYEEMGEKIPEK